MGVHGLSSFVQSRSSLGHTVILTPPAAPAPPPTALIVDFLSFTYHIGLKETLRGGQYQEVRNSLKKSINYWRACNLAPEFVLDGEPHPLRSIVTFSTATSLTLLISSQLTGPSEHTKLDTVLSRSTQTLSRCVQYMRATDGERATPRMRNMVARMPSLTQAACVYELHKLGVPIHFAEGEADAATAELASRKRGYAMSSDSDYYCFPSEGLGYVPILEMEYGGEGTSRLDKLAHNAPVQLRLRVYRHEDIAAFLKLPPSMMPLFAALVGNDQADYQASFKAGPSTAAGKGKKGSRPPSNRMKGPNKLLLPLIAREISTFAAQVPPDTPPASLPSLCLNAVLPRLGVATPSLQMIHDLLLSAESYKLQPVTTPSPTFPLHPRDTDSLYQAKARALYLAAFQRGQLSGSVLNILKHRRVIRPGQLEMHEFPSPGAILGTPIRRWTYALVQNAVCGEEELVITEVVRKGTTLVPTEVKAEKLQDLIVEALGSTDLSLDVEEPILLGSPELRFSVFLLAFGGANQSILGSPLWPLVLSLRHIRLHLTARPWTEHDHLSAIVTAYLLLNPRVPRPRLKLSSVPERELIQRSAELVSVLQHVSGLAEALLVGSKVEPAVHRLFDGQLLHGLMGLAGKEGKMDAVVAGLSKEGKRVVGGALRLVLA